MIPAVLLADIRDVFWTLFGCNVFSLGILSRLVLFGLWCREN